MPIAKLRIWLTLPVILLCSIACAHLTFEENGREVKGITYYHPAPYLKVDAAAQGGCTANIIWLPDYSKRMTIIPHYWLIGTLGFNPSLADGWNLTGLNSTTDTKVPETITALTGVAKLGLGIYEYQPQGVLRSYNPDVIPNESNTEQTPKFKGEEWTGPGLYKLLLAEPDTVARLDPLKTSFWSIQQDNSPTSECTSWDAKSPLGPCGSTVDQKAFKAHIYLVQVWVLRDENGTPIRCPTFQPQKQ